MGATPTATIEPQRWYTMQDIVRMRMIPFATSVWSVRNLVNADRAKRSKSILNPIVTGNGRGTKYLVKGEKIIKFVKLVEAGKANV